MSHSNSNKAVLFALGGNLAIAIIKFIAAFFTTSTSMLAEAIHSIADCFNQIFLLIGGKRASRPRDEMHPFGHGREEYFWGFMVAVLLFFGGALFSVYEGIHKVLNPEPIHFLGWSLVILGAAIFIEGSSFRVAYIEFKKSSQGSLYKGIVKSVDTSLIVILLEDTAALMGLMFAFIFMILASTVNPIFDGFGSICIGIILGVVSFILARELRNLIIGEGMPRENLNQIKAIIARDKNIKHINRLASMAMGKKYIVIVSLDFIEELNSSEVEDSIEQIKLNILKVNQNIEEIFIEARDANRNNLV